MAQVEVAALVDQLPTLERIERNARRAAAVIRLADGLVKDGVRKPVELEPGNEDSAVIPSDDQVLGITTKATDAFDAIRSDVRTLPITAVKESA